MRRVAGVQGNLAEYTARSVYESSFGERKTLSAYAEAIRVMELLDRGAARAASSSLIRTYRCSSVRLLNAGEDSLLFFYMTLAEHLRNWIAPAFDWMDYVFGPKPRVAYEGGMTFEYSYYYDEDNPPDWLSTHDGVTPQVVV
jgi:hypothetical protein